MTIDRFERKIILKCSFLMSTLFCVTGGVLISIPTLASYTRWCALIGKMGINAIYSTVFLIGAELFPTPIRYDTYAHAFQTIAFKIKFSRSKAISFGMAICTIGGFISPLIIETQVVAPWLPFGLYGLAAFLGFLSSFCIPGTDFKHSISSYDMIHIIC